MCLQLLLLVPLVVCCALLPMLLPLLLLLLVCQPPLAPEECHKCDAFAAIWLQKVDGCISTVLLTEPWTRKLDKHWACHPGRWECCCWGLAHLQVLQLRQLLLLCACVLLQQQDLILAAAVPAMQLAAYNCHKVTGTLLQVPTSRCSTAEAAAAVHAWTLCSAVAMCGRLSRRCRLAAHLCCCSVPSCCCHRCCK